MGTFNGSFEKLIIIIIFLVGWSMCANHYAGRESEKEIKRDRERDKVSCLYTEREREQ